MRVNCATVGGEDNTNLDKKITRIDQPTVAV